MPQYRSLANPEYGKVPFTEFDRVTRRTQLESLNLDWREIDLPERERTKHVHRLHPYLGKFIPQLVEIFLRKFRPRFVCDPFCGSGTALVEALALGIDSVGCDISAFNCLLARVKTQKYDLATLEKEVEEVLSSLDLMPEDKVLEHSRMAAKATEYLRTWFHRKALARLLAYKSLIGDKRYSDLFKIVLCRAARSSRLTTHFDLDFPRAPQVKPYYCYKHRRTCEPTDDAFQFLRRYTVDSFKRVSEFAQVRPSARVSVIHGDARAVDFPSPLDMVITSPPYVGLIDYHEQHRYAYELLRLGNNEHREIGPASQGASKRAIARYTFEIVDALQNVGRKLKKNGVMMIIVNDKHGLYEQICGKLGFREEHRLKRHVNRRTGRRSTDFFEEVLIWRRR